MWRGRWSVGFLGKTETAASPTPTPRRADAHMAGLDRGDLRWIPTSATDRSSGWSSSHSSRSRSSSAGSREGELRTVKVRSDVRARRGIRSMLSISSANAPGVHHARGGQPGCRMVIQVVGGSKAELDATGDVVRFVVRNQTNRVQRHAEATRPAAPPSDEQPSMQSTGTPCHRASQVVVPPLYGNNVRSDVDSGVKRRGRRSAARRPRA